MRRAITLGVAALAFAACGAQAALSATATVPARLTWVQPAGIQIGNVLTMPSVSMAPVASITSGGVAIKSDNNQQSTGNARLTIRGQPGDVVSTTVPESFTVVRSGGQETLTVKTNTNAEYQFGSGDVVLGGAILNGNSMSVDIGGSLALASAQNLVPGPYEGMLVVVVQYN